MSGIDIISDTTGQAIVESIKALATKIGHGKVMYGVHINSNDSNPETAVTYLADAVGMTPAAMNYSTGVFDYGSWADAFFMPRPCMLKTNGTVDYYLDENDYTKKTDGTASDVANVDYDGNAMMEWGDGVNAIWWKIAPDKGNNNSASIYVANYKADDGFRNLNHIDINGASKLHFYTPIYNGSLDGNDKLRSISGQMVIKNRTATNERAYAKANGNGYEIEQFVDRLLINILLIIMSKSLDTQTAFGEGMTSMSYAEALLLTTGTMDSKGLFWGENSGTHGVKIFGMENWWGNQWRRTSGYMIVNDTVKVKLSPSTADGSTVVDYNTDGSGYLEIPDATPTGESSGYIKKMLFSENGMFGKDITGSSSTYYSDGQQFTNSIAAFALFGGYLNAGRSCGAFFASLRNSHTGSWWAIGASLSYK